MTPEWLTSSRSCGRDPSLVDEDDHREAGRQCRSRERGSAATRPGESTRLPARAGIRLCEGRVALLRGASEAHRRGCRGRWADVEHSRAVLCRAPRRGGGIALSRCRSPTCPRATSDAPLACLRFEPSADRMCCEVRLRSWPGCSDDRLLATAGYHGRPVRWLA